MDPDIATSAARLDRLVDQQEIRDVIYRYCRGIDRRDYDLVRACYHADATDDHGDYRGGVDGFITYVMAGLPRYEATMHFIGNVLVEPVNDAARAESYIVAHHRIASSSSKPARDFVVGLRYVDDFERRNNEWRIAARVCAFEWSRLDSVEPGGWAPGATATLGRHDATDVVFAPSIAAWHA